MTVRRALSLPGPTEPSAARLGLVWKAGPGAEPGERGERHPERQHRQSAGERGQAERADRQDRRPAGVREWSHTGDI